MIEYEKRNKAAEKPFQNTTRNIIQEIPIATSQQKRVVIFVLKSYQTSEIDVLLSKV